jgi:hypothetical protein
MFTVDEINLLIGPFLPLLVGFLTSKSVPSWVQGALLLLLSFVAASIRYMIAGQPIDPAGIGTILLSAQLAYATVLKSLSQYLQGIGPIKDAPQILATQEIKAHEPA